MIPYDDIPEHLVITHPRHKTPVQVQGGRGFTVKWRPEWVPFIRAEREIGRTTAQIAGELNITAETLRKHMHEEGERAEPRK